MIAVDAVVSLTLAIGVGFAVGLTAKLSQTYPGKLIFGSLSLVSLCLPTLTPLLDLGRTNYGHQC